MKKIIIILIVLSIGVIAGVSGVAYVRSFHKVTFTLSSDVSQAILYRSAASKNGGPGAALQTITSSTIVSLQDGSYYLAPKGDKIASDSIPFTVKGQDTAVAVNPAYSPAYLSSLLAAELPTISAALSINLQPALAQYSLVQPRLYEKGEWFGALLTKKVSDPRDQRDYYRVVMQKQNGKWGVIHRPDLILTTSTYPNVPIDILKNVNRLAPS